MAVGFSNLKQALSVRLNAFGKMSSTRVYKDKRYRALIVFCLIGTVGFILLPKGTTETKALTVADAPVTKPKFDLTRYDMALEIPSATEVKSVSIKVKSGDSLGPLLQKNGLTGPQAYRVTEAFSTVHKPTQIRVGEVFDVYFADESFSDLTYKPSVDRTVFVKKLGETYSAKAVDAEFKMETLTVKGRIENSLYLDANRMGAPDKVIQQFANIYEYSVDFQRDIQPGDAFEMFFEVARDHNGNIIKAGDLLFTSFSPRGKTSAYYLYNDDKGDENFYDLDGKTAKRKLRATPINGARLSSSFGRRKHPILGYRKMHAGVDFAAPRGTPILAAGTGTVERANRYGGYGNYIRIKHSDGYQTAYAHLNKFARGIRAGARVTQDQVIGYVGTTGRSTGPHLHYEVILNGKKINPSRLSQLSGKPLDQNQMASFKNRQKAIDSDRLEAKMVTNIAPTNAAVEVLSAETVETEALVDLSDAQ